MVFSLKKKDSRGYFQVETDILAVLFFFGYYNKFKSVYLIKKVYYAWLRNCLI